MAIDSALKRRRALFIDPIPDGSIDAIDRAQVSKFYYESSILSFTYELEKLNYITICGREQPVRFGTDKLIDLFKFVPTIDKQSTFPVLVQELQDYFNSMYSATNKFYYTEEDI